MPLGSLPKKELTSASYFIIVMLLREAKSKFDSLDKSLIPNYGRNKGKRGQIIEKLLGKELCSGLLDFDDGEGKSFKTGQTIAVTQLKHVLDELINGVSFKQSKVFTKLSNCWFIRFTKEGKFDTDIIFKNPFFSVCYYYTWRWHFTKFFFEMISNHCSSNNYCCND